MGKYCAFVIALFLFIMVAKSTDGDTINLGGGEATNNISYDNTVGQSSGTKGLSFGNFSIGFSDQPLQPVNGASGNSYVAYGSYSNKSGSYPSVAGAASTVAEAEAASYGSKIGTVYSVSKSEYVLLCNLLFKEAGDGNDYPECPAVSDVDMAKVIETVMNRVYDSEFPATIQDVIFSRNQYRTDISSYSFDSKVSYFNKDVVITYLNGGYTNHGYFYYYGGNWGNKFFYKNEERQHNAELQHYLSTGEH